MIIKIEIKIKIRKEMTNPKKENKKLKLKFQMEIKFNLIRFFKPLEVECEEVARESGPGRDERTFHGSSHFEKIFRVVDFRNCAHSLQPLKCSPFCL